MVCALSAFAIWPVVGSFQAIPDVHLVSAARAQELPNPATQELFLAVDRNDLAAVRAAIDKGADVEARDYTGTQPVDMAIDRGYFDIAHYLISVRNAAQAQQTGQPVPPTPSTEELYKSQTSAEASQPDDANPFASVESSNDAPVDNPVDAPIDTPDDALLDVLVEVPVEAPAEQPQASPAFEPSSLAAADTAESDPFAVTAPSEISPPSDALPIPQAPPAPYKSVVQAQTEQDVAPQVEAPAPIIDVVTPEPEPAKAKEATAKPEKPSAARTFITTFFDFFKPPNVTGVSRREQDRSLNNGSISNEELARQLQEIAAERGDAVIKGPEVPISPEELARQLPPAPDLGELTPEEMASLGADTPALPPYPVHGVQSGATEPQPGMGDAFGDLTIDDATLDDEQPLEGSTQDATPGATMGADQASLPPAPSFEEAPGVPGKRYDPTKPFGGGVDPDVLAWLGLDPRTALVVEDGAVKVKLEAIAADTQTPPASAAASAPAEDDPFSNPFDTLDGEQEPAVSELLEGLDEPQTIASKEPKSPPSPDGASDDPFAMPSPEGATDDPFATPPGGDVDELAGLLESTSESVSGTKGWDVTKVEGADLPREVVVLSEIEPTGEVLDGVELALGSDTVIGQEVGEDRIKLLDQESIHKPCISKGGTETVFCIDTVSWPFELEEVFLVDTIMYQGTRAVARYDAGRATNFHSLFRTEAFENVIGYYTKRYGPPTQMIERAIAPLAAPRQANPTYLWQSREPGTDTVTTLEIRKFDDAQTGFPDTNRGALLLYRSHAQSIFPQLSQLELMVLKADAAIPVESTAPTPGDVWN